MSIRTPQSWFHLRAGVAVLLLALGLSAPALADTTYEYAGNNFNFFPTASSYSSDDSVTGTLVLSEALAASQDLADVSALVVSWSFTAGGDGFTWQGRNDGGGLPGAFALGTDGDGNVDLWDVNIFAPPDTRSLQTANNGVDAPLDAVRDGIPIETLAARLAAPGSWSVVPEPGTAVLLAFGLSGLAASRPRPRRP